jgi:hypothetical protein
VQEKEWRIKYNQGVPASTDLIRTITAASFKYIQQQGFSRKGTYKEWAKMKYPEES